MKLEEFLKTIVKKRMYPEIEGGIANGFPVMTTIALFAYSEMIGGLWRIVNGETEEVVFGPGQSNKNFASFLSAAGKDYTKLNSKNTYRIIRGGLIHRYFIRIRSTIEMDTSDPKAIKDYGLNCAVKFHGDEYVYFNVNQYFKDMKKTVDKILKTAKKRNRLEVEIATHIDETQYLILS
ncbi:TVG1186360 [Thermoplasma volcanium GSS1]|uniref:TVG1186360 protein n=1 Tax=Thermoplasma volcanium (strain ATCC 51530 / DSM 4299 / JCM 9571 / NBRC 15438 / GSS1) TaxID=273116 RepID=Q979K4_THEVO|nr:hypothetical protein [Thermoplasma volcanium]BAB60299.1 TVG1186360 [Thermoplasma volcanium GSS1]